MGLASIGQPQVAQTSIAPTFTDRVKSAISSMANAISAGIKDVINSIESKPPSLSNHSVDQKTAGSVPSENPMLQRGSEPHKNAMERMEQIIIKYVGDDDVKTVMSAAIQTEIKAETERGALLTEPDLAAKFAAHSEKMDDLNKMLEEPVLYWNGSDEMQTAIKENALREILVGNHGQTSSEMNDLRDDLIQNDVIKSTDMKMEQSITLNDSKLSDTGVIPKIIKGIGDFISDVGTIISFLAKSHSL